jgi:hypothetical protein
MKTGRKTKTRTTKTKPKVKEFKKCIKCQKDKDIALNYHVSYSPLHGDSKVPVCKQCLYEMFDSQYNGSNTHELIKEIMKLIDKPYLYHLVDTSIHSLGTEVADNVFRIYLKNVVMRQYSGMTYKDSIFEPDGHATPQPIQQQNKNNFIITDDIIDKWGDGYSQEEYRAFERKYGTLKNNYQEKTAMHTEALITYIRYRVKEELATANGDSKAAKEWGTLAKDAATAAKINPSQLSKSDLSDGLDTFGQLVRTVEQAVDIIPILPQFRKRPQDDVDFTILCYVNYIRDLKGLPLCKYEDLFEFINERKKEYESKAKDADLDE